VKADFGTSCWCLSGISNGQIRGLKLTPRIGGDLKSNVSDYLEVVQCIYIDACAKCSADVSDLLDLRTIRSRVQTEGISFLTITLPNFCRDFESSLKLGYIDPTYFQGFRKHGSIPAFLRGMIGLLFDRETGRIYDDTNSQFASEAPVIVEGVRQICLTFKKLELPCTPQRVNATLANFIATEQALQSFSAPPEDIAEFRDVSFVLWNRMLGRLRLDLLVPKHGPGATAERISGNQKYAWRFWHERLEPYFPFIHNAYVYSAMGEMDVEIVTFVKPEEEKPVRVTPVPKTLKAPRIIAIEPVCMQYAQQAVLRALTSAIGTFELTKRHVNFDDQSVNQRLAMSASKTGRLATIDLSDASDRVPRDLALEMFRSNPDFMDAIDACRSSRAEMPDGTIVPLSKFASMGSALCFPVESMYFYTICVAALLKKRNLPVTYANCFKVSRRVFVYGDDILCPTDDADVILEYLQKYNCKVNATKTFLSGKFRESCGVDAYDGKLVTPTYLRETRPENKRQASKLVSWVATANLLYKRGYWHTAQLMYCKCEQILGPLPYVSSTSAILGRVSYLGYRTAERWNYDTQTLEVRGWSASPVYSSDHIEGYPALQKSLLNLEGKPSEFGLAPLDASPQGALHLEQTARHGAVVLKRRWSMA